jgi:hypothetical protein
MSEVTYEGDEEEVRLVLMEALRLSTQFRQLKEGLRLTHFGRCFQLSRGGLVYLLEHDKQRRVHIVI